MSQSDEEVDVKMTFSDMGVGSLVGVEIKELVENGSWVRDQRAGDHERRLD